MNTNPIVTRFRHFNAAMLGIAVLLLLLACRKLSLQISVGVVIIAVVASFVAIITWHHLRTRRGVVLIGSMRRSFDQLNERLIKDKPLGATDRAGRRIGPVRELTAHKRDKTADDAALLKAVKQHLSAHPQELASRDRVLLLAWIVGLFIAAVVVAWLLLT